VLLTAAAEQGRASVKNLLIIALSLSLAGCAASTHYVSNVSVYEDSSSASKKYWDHFFISGIGQEQEIDAARVCGGADRVAKTTTLLTPANWAAGFFTLGIYTPRTTEVYCK
jgi:hypothetical protein